MKGILRSIYYSFPIQLMLLHLRKQQLLLAFWILLAAIVNGSIMRSFGAVSIFLAPEYLGQVSFLSGVFTGLSFGVFFMSWNIASFLFFSRHFKFLAATSKPFRNYTINNLGIPFVFLIYYFVHLMRFELSSELMNLTDVIVLPLGILTGLSLLLIISFIYIAGSERAIHRTLKSRKNPPNNSLLPIIKNIRPIDETKQIQVANYFSGFFKVRYPRPVLHYNRRFLERVFERNHYAAFLAIIFAFFLLMNYGYFLDKRMFQLPAASSVLLFFSILIAATGAFVYWLKGWSVLVFIGIIAVFNWLIDQEVIDMRNKAFGLSYQNQDQWPEYSTDHLLTVASSERCMRDSINMIRLLEQWKDNQQTAKPYLYLMSVSGGGIRSATFSFHTMRSIDSTLQGNLMKKLFLFSGASGGMFGATYYRELYRQKSKDAGVWQLDEKYGENISRDLLNPIFSSLVTRDLITPSQYFTVGAYRYVKDRGYAFEEQLNYNTGHILKGTLRDYFADEAYVRIPLGIYLSTVSQDGRKLMICSQPVSFLMHPQPDSTSGVTVEPDAIDYVSYFEKQNPYNIRLLTALRMNATFPIVLPNVWLPTQPVVDVMDAGMRDNYGMEINCRFLHKFRKWIQENTSGVVLLQIRDHKKSERKKETRDYGLGDIFYKPFTALQNNFYSVQDYYLESMMSYLQESVNIKRFVFVYEPLPNKPNATLNFHLTTDEKRSVIESASSSQIQSLLHQLSQIPVRE
jgi:hypothetical protein